MRRAALVAALVVGLAATGSGQGFDDVLNPDRVTYDPETETYYDSDGKKTDPPPVPPFLENRGWRRDGEGRLLDPKGRPVDPAEMYPSPETNANPGGYTYDPETRTYYDSFGEETGYPVIPDYLVERGYRQDPVTGEIFDENGDPIDLSTIYPEPDRRPAVLYDPATGKYYAGNGDEAPPGDFRLYEEGWTRDPKTGKWTDPEGKEHDPSEIFDAPDARLHNGGLRYDPETGEYYDARGDRTEGDLPRYMEDRGYRMDAEGRITDPDGREVNPSTIYEPPPEPDFTYDPETRRWYGPDGGRLRTPDLPDYMEDRGYELDYRTGKIRDPEGNELEPSELFPEPDTSGHLYYDPETGKFYAGPNEAPPSLPDNLEDRGWRWDPAEGKFRDGDGNLVDPADLYESPYPFDLPEGKEEEATAPEDLSSAGFESGGTLFPAGGELALFGPGGPAGGTTVSPVALNLPSATSAAPAPEVQLMMVRLLEGTVPGNGRGRLASLRPVQAEATPRASFRALGVSSGAAFTVELSNPAALPVEIAAAGVVLEPLQPEGGADVARELASRPGARTELPADGYCLEYDKLPPPAGTVFRVASPETQARFEPLRNILRAAKRVLDEGGLSPDSDPESYFHSIVQWALWSEEKELDEGTFTEAFVDRTRKNFEAAGRSWTSALADTVRGLAPNRWKDVKRVLDVSRTLPSPRP